MSYDAWLIDNVLVWNYIDDLHTRTPFEIYFTRKILSRELLFCDLFTIIFAVLFILSVRARIPLGITYMN